MAKKPKPKTLKLVLLRGGSYQGQNFEASPEPQDVPTVFGKAFLARGLAEHPGKEPGAPVPPAAPVEVAEGPVVVAETPADVEPGGDGGAVADSLVVTPGAPESANPEEA